MKKWKMFLLLLVLLFLCGCKQEEMPDPETTTEEIFIIMDASEGAVISKEEAKIGITVPDMNHKELINALIDRLVKEGIKKENITLVQWMEKEVEAEKGNKDAPIETFVDTGIRALTKEHHLIFAMDSGDYFSDMAEVSEQTGVNVIFFYKESCEKGETAYFDGLMKQMTKHLNGEISDFYSDMKE